MFINSPECALLMRRHTAIHEAGHAIVALYYGALIKSIRIVSQESVDEDGINAFLEAMKDESQSSTGAVQYVTKPLAWNAELILNRVDINYAGIAAEELIFGDHNSGGAIDIKKATNNLHYYIASGMDDVWLSPTQVMDEQRIETIKTLSMQRREITTHILQQHRQLLELLALFLLRFDKLDMEFNSLESLERYLKVKMSDRQPSVNSFS